MKRVIVFIMIFLFIPAIAWAPPIGPGGIYGGAQDTNTTYSAANGVSLSNTEFSLDTTFFSGDATVSAAGTVTVSILPSDLGQAGATTGQVIKWDGTQWAPDADAGAASGASVAFKTVVGDSGGNAVADEAEDTLTIAGGDGIATVGSTNESITISIDVTFFSGDATVAPSGTVTVANDSHTHVAANISDTVGSDKIAADMARDSELTSFTGSANIGTVGTINTGTWNGTDIAVADGGTGAGTAAGARANLEAPPPMDSVTIAGSSLTIDTYNLVKWPVAVTITDIHCITDTGTVVIEMGELSATGGTFTTVDAPITCDSNGAEDDGTLTNGTIDANDWFAARIGTEASSPTWVNITWYYTVD